MAIVLVVLAALAIGVLFRRWNSKPSIIRATSDSEPADSIFVDSFVGGDSPSDHHTHRPGGADFSHHDSSSHSFDSGHGGGFDCGFHGGGHH